MSDVISDFFGDMDEEDSNKKIDTSIPEISSVRMEESRVDLTEAHYAEMAEEESRLEKYLAEPAKDGWRGWLSNMGIVMLPGPKEKMERRIRYRRWEEQSQLKAVLRSEKDHVPYIAIFSEKGGAGKSTTSALIAYAFADFGRKSVALAEVNPHRGTLPDKMGTSTEKCLVNLISDINNAEDVDDVDPRAYMPQVDGLSINVLAGNVANGPRRYTTTAHDVVQVCTSLSKVWPLVILDNGTDIEDRGSSWEDKSAAYGSFAVASSLILVTNPDLQESKRVVTSTLELLESKADDPNLNESVRREWRNLRESVVLAIVDKTNTHPKKLETESDGTLIGSDDAFEVYNHFQSKVRGVVIIPYDPALVRSPIHLQNLQGRTKLAAMKLAALAWESA